MKLSEYLKPALGVAFVAVGGLRLLLVRAPSAPGRERHAGPGAGDRDQVHQCLLLRHGARHRLHRAAPRSADRRRSGGLQRHRPVRPRRRHGHRKSGTGAPDRAAAAYRAPAPAGPGRSRCAPPPPASSPRSGPRSARRPRRRPARCSAFPSTTKSSSKPKCRASICSSSIRARRCASAATTRPIVVGKVRQISPQIDRTTQLGKVRISLNNNPSLKVGMFARANIDAKRSCGVAVPRTAIDRLTAAGRQRQHRSRREGCGSA